MSKIHLYTVFKTLFEIEWYYYLYYAPLNTVYKLL